jgi:hypothetical protein
MDGEPLDISVLGQPLDQSLDQPLDLPAVSA